MVCGFVDAHHHLWDLGRHYHDWLQADGVANETEVLGDYAALRRSHLIAEYLDACASAETIKSVHVQVATSYQALDPVDETRWVQSISDSRGFPSAFVVYSDLRAPDFEAQLARHCESPGVRGVRIPEVGAADDPSFRRGYGALQRWGLSYEFVGTQQTLVRYAAPLADAFPLVPIVIGYAGLPIGVHRRDERARWMSALGALGERPNVFVKVCGFGLSDHEWTLESARDLALYCIDAFGMERTLFGSNWPVDTLYRSYSETVAAYRWIVSAFGDDDQARLLRGNAERLYRI